MDVKDRGTDGVAKATKEKREQDDKQRKRKHERNTKTKSNKNEHNFFDAQMGLGYYDQVGYGFFSISLFTYQQSAVV